MKIFTAAQIKACDAFTIGEEGIASAMLMERAAYACFQWIREHYGPGKPVLVVCGMGNNGGDGLALTRILLREGFSAQALILRHAEQFSEDAAHHLGLLHEMDPGNLRILEEGTFMAEIDKDILVVEALFGTGISRPLAGWPARFLAQLNELPNDKISIDMPAGLPADSLPAKGSIVFRATHTLTFQFLKRSLLHEESAAFAGHISVLEIGLSRQFIAATHSQCHTIEAEDIRSIYAPRLPFAHKGTYGKAMLIGGSYGKTGAIALSTRAALRSGAGLVFTQAPACAYTVLQTLNPEAMFLASGTQFLEKINLEDDQVSVGIGPGMDTQAQTAEALFSFLERRKQPVVLDADALNIFSQHPEHLHLIPPGSVLTPHPKEFERLFGTAPDSMQRTELARAKAMKHNVYIVLKGRHTAVLTPSGMCWYNRTGNPGMATGGSGDVLTGIITGLIAQEYNAGDAVLLGVYLHGRSGDLAAARLSGEALIAGDLCDYLGAAFLEIKADYTSN